MYGVVRPSATVYIVLALVMIAVLTSYACGEVVRNPIGVVVRVSNWEITVVNMTQATYIRSDNSYYSAKQGFKIVLVTLRITNTGNKTSDIGDIWSFVLVTGAKKSYDKIDKYDLEYVRQVTEDVVRNATTYNALNPFAKVAPDTAVEGDIMFQIPATESPAELHFKVGIFEPTEVVVYLQPPYTYTLIGGTPATPITATVTTIITVTITVKETLTLPTKTTITSISLVPTTIREVYTTFIPTTVTSVSTVPTTVREIYTTTVMAVDWTTTGAVSVVLLLLGLLLGFLVRRR